MSNKIEQEYKASLKYNLKCIPNNKELVQLTQENVALVEAMIRHDSDYSNSNDETNSTSSAHCLSKLSSVLFKGSTLSKNEYTKIVFECVSAIDRENSTHLNADGVGREEMTSRIVNIEKKRLLEYLQHPKKQQYELVKILSEKTHPTDSKMKARNNLSFASKFCHYACMYIFKNTEAQDNFSIFDNIVCTNMPKYAKYYNIPLSKNYKKIYSEYIDIIDKIIKASGDKISRNGFDHLLWYFHKAK